MSVGDDFANFRDEYTITRELINSISYGCKRITKQLNTDFWATASNVHHSLYVGSYGRETSATWVSKLYAGPYGREAAVTGVNKVKIAFVLPTTLYCKYDGYQTNGQSALLQAVKESIQKIYPTSDSLGDGHAIVGRFRDNIKFQVLPVFEATDGEGFVFPNVNNEGSWKSCNPRAEMKAIEERSDATKRNLKYLGRMMRVWRDYCDVPMSGILIDTLAYQFIENYDHRVKSFAYHDVMARDFFDYLSKQDQEQTLWHAPGSGSKVRREGEFEQKARIAYLRSIEAIRYDRTDHYKFSRRQKWREVFGPLHPDGTRLSQRIRWSASSG